jgi:hypothetical protein
MRWHVRVGLCQVANRTARWRCDAELVFTLTSRAAASLMYIQKGCLCVHWQSALGLCVSPCQATCWNRVASGAGMVRQLNIRTRRLAVAAVDL